MAYEHILVEHDRGVAILTMNRPDVLNAMSNQLSTELHDAVKQAEADDGIGCIVVTGAGERAFSAGGDIHEQRADDRRFSQDELDARAAVRNRGSYEISACAKPTIGMMNGLAYGGAAVLASSLDMRRLRALELPLPGRRLRPHQQHLDPAQPGRLADRQGAPVLGAHRRGAEAYRIGLLNHLVPADQLRAKTMELATMIAANRRDAVMGIKALMLQDMGRTLEEQWAAERTYTTQVTRGAKAEEAFPDFIARKGRPVT